jgi:hypothetical protein
MGLVEGREVLGDEQCRFVNLLACGGGVFVDEHPPKFPQSLSAPGQLA